MTSPSRRREYDLPRNLTMNRRQMMLGATAMALGGGLATSNASARQGHSPNQPATPASSSPSPLMTMLGMVPAGIAEEAGDTHVGWYYADIARQFDTLGLHHDLDGPDFDNEPYIDAVLGLKPGAPTFDYALVEEFTSAIGFQPFGVDQSLYVGAPGRPFSLFKADFDVERLVAAWLDSGYEPVETASGVPAWTIGPEGEWDFDHPVQGFTFRQLNNVAIVGDILIYTSRMDLLERALAMAESGEASMASDPVFGPLAESLPETTVSAVSLPPIPPDLGFVVMSDEVREPIEAAFEEALEEFGSMPPSMGIVTAVSEGAVSLDWEWPLVDGTPVPNARENAGTAHIRLGMPSPEDAATAAEVAAGRWNSLRSLLTLMPYTDMAEVAAAEASGNVAMLDLVQLERARLWSHMFESKDVLPFVPV